MVFVAPVRGPPVPQVHADSSALHVEGIGEQELAAVHFPQGQVT